MIAFAPASMRLIGPFHEALISLESAPSIQQKMQPALRQLLIITAVSVPVNMNTISWGFPTVLRVGVRFSQWGDPRVCLPEANEQANESACCGALFDGGQAVHERTIAARSKNCSNPCGI